MEIYGEEKQMSHTQQNFFKQSKTERLSIDMDDCTIIEAMQKAFQIKDNYQNVKIIHIIESSSRNGYHIIAELKHKITFEEQLKLREHYGDCYGRLKYSKEDLKYGFNPDVMFTAKKINGRWKYAKEVMTI